MCPFKLVKILLSLENGQLRCQGTQMLEGASNDYHLFFWSTDNYRNDWEWMPARCFGLFLLSFFFLVADWCRKWMLPEFLGTFSTICTIQQLLDRNLTGKYNQTEYVGLHFSCKYRIFRMSKNVNYFTVYAKVSFAEIIHKSYTAI